jgi:hypothetical protein
MKTMESIPLKDVVNYQAPTKPEALQKLGEAAQDLAAAYTEHYGKPPFEITYMCDLCEGSNYVLEEAAMRMIDRSWQFLIRHESFLVRKELAKVIEVSMAIIHRNYYATAKKK